MGNKRRRWKGVLVGALVLSSGCGRSLGHVVQGRCLTDEGAQRACVLLDEERQQPIRFSLVGAEMGPRPTAGQLLDLDHTTGQVTFFDPSLNRVRRLRCQIVQETGNLCPDDPRVQGQRFPQVDPVHHLVTVLCPCQDCAHRKCSCGQPSVRQVTLSVPASELGTPGKWIQGDVLRIYYVQEGQARRVMNVTRTDLLRGE